MNRLYLKMNEIEKLIESFQIYLSWFIHFKIIFSTNLPGTPAHKADTSCAPSVSLQTLQWR